VRLTVRMLGALEVSISGTPAAVTSDRLRSVLAVLALSAGEAVPIGQLADAVWGDDQPAHSRRTVQLYVARLRNLLGPDAIRTTPDGYLLDTEPGNVDALRFERLLDAAGRAPDTSAERARLAEALALWGGAPFEDVKPMWRTEVEAARLTELHLAGTERLMDIDLADGHPGDLVARLGELTARHPLRERFWSQLMRALWLTGRQSEALAAYQRLHRLLADEVGVEPCQEVRQLHQRILNTEPEPVVTVPRQLPADVPAFTGRARELAHLGRVPETNTVVITAIDGMAGIGKTALAVRAAHQLASDFPDGQLFVDLHGYTEGMAPVEPGDALDRLLRALGVPGEHVPRHLDERAALFRSRLAGRAVLIVLDNAATEAQVAPLLPGSGRCLVLVTSRHRLVGLDQTHTVSLDTLPRADAVALFARTAGEERLADEPPDAVAEVVDLCGRLPLAIRIAAARFRSHPSWTVAHLVDRLHQAEHRLAELEAGRRSVAAALDLSHQHLPTEQRRAYELLGLHPGTDIDPHAAAALFDSTVPDAGRILDQLLDAHLLQEPVPGRYGFHDLTRAHAAHTATRDQTEPSRRAAVSRLFDHYWHTAAVAMDVAYPYEREHRPRIPPARTPGPDLSDPGTALAWLDAALPNLLAAAGHAVQHGMPRRVLDLSAILYRHLYSRGHYHDAESLHHHALVLARSSGDRVGEVDALVGLGHVYRMHGRYARCADQFGQALRIARVVGHRAGELRALIGLGHVYRMHGRLVESADHFGRALRIARATGHRAADPDALTGLGHILRMQGRPEHAAEHYEQALGIARATGHRAGEGYALTGLGQIRRLQGRPEQAAEHYEQALRIARAARHSAGELTALTGLGHVHRMRGRHHQAVDHYRQLLGLAREAGDRNFEYEARQGLGREAYATGDPTAAVAHHSQALALAQELGQPVDQARANDGLAYAHRALGQDEHARTRWRLALDLLTSLGIDHTDDEEATATAIRAQLAASRRVEAA
jgi:DNA-binding SARP family transcriptional activator/tetratricopeptide (TPR) repeat protein